MASVNKIQAGQILHDYHNYKAGNTNMRVEGHWIVKVIQVDKENKRALCSWNGNAPQWYNSKRLSKLRIKEKA